MSLSRVRVRLLPWRPRWRTGRPDRWDLGLPDIGVGDDPLSAVVGLVLLVLLLPVVLVVVLGVIVLGVELSLLLLLLPLAWAGQVFGLCHSGLCSPLPTGRGPGRRSAEPAPCCGVADSCARLLLELRD